MIEIVSRDTITSGYSAMDISFGTHTIHTNFTRFTFQVNNWLTYVLNNNRYNNRNRYNTLIVGLDLEWRPNNRNENNPVATLQLCVGNQCLVFHIMYATPSIPQSLINFLGSPNNVFVGVGIEGDLQKLQQDYQIHVRNYTDLRWMAERVYADRDMRSTGLKNLARRVMGVQMEKPARITRSAWDHEWLTEEQVEYASIDAFASFEIGRILFGMEDYGYGF